MLMMLKFVYLVYLRPKIEAAVRKLNNAVPDEDCPDDPESTRYWTKTKMVHSETDTKTQSLRSTIGFQATPEMADAMLGNAPMAAVRAGSSLPKDESIKLARELASTRGSGSHSL